MRVQFSSYACGFTLVEIVVAMACLSIAITALCAAYLSAIRLDDVSQQSAIAAQNARRTLEEIPLENFSTLFSRYNADPSDDPGGAGTAPGSRNTVLSQFWVSQRYSNFAGSSFPVTGIKSLPFDVPGHGTLHAIGRIEFPNYSATHSLHEVRVRIVWKGPTEATPPDVAPDGTTFVEVVTLMTQRLP